MWWVRDDHVFAGEGSSALAVLLGAIHRGVGLLNHVLDAVLGVEGRRSDRYTDAQEGERFGNAAADRG